MRPELPLHDDVVRLTALLGSPDPDERDHHALPLLVSWVESGALDDVLPAVGDGMTRGLLAGLGEVGTPSVLRRTGSAQVLASVLRRDAARDLSGAGTVTRWADSLFTWLVRERDTCPGRGADARLVPGPVGHGADALAALARSRHLDEVGLTVLLDVVADRLLAPDERLPGTDLDLLARACAVAVARDLVPDGVLTGWVNRLRAAGAPTPSEGVVHFLRALHLRLALGSERPAARADLLIEVAAAVRDSSPDLFHG